MSRALNSRQAYLIQEVVGPSGPLRLDTETSAAVGVLPYLADPIRPLLGLSIAPLARDGLLLVAVL